MVAKSLNIPKTVVLRILKENLGKRKLCARFVPHSLINEQRKDRVTSCQDIIAMADADKTFFNKIITGDETWCFAYDPKTKRQSSDWVGETFPWPKKLLTIFLDSRGVVRNEFVPEGKTANAEFHKGVMDCLLKHIQQVHPAVFCPQDFSCCTIMRPPTKLQVCQFLPKKITTLYHPPILSRFISARLFSVPQVEN